MSLFRSEVFEGRRFRLHGDVLLTSASSNWSLAGLLAAIVVAAGVWIATGHYARTEIAVGRVVPDGAMTRIVPMRAGVIVQLSVKEGDLVQAGQPLATVLIEQASADRSHPATEDLGAIDRQQVLVGQQIGLSQRSGSDEGVKLTASIKQYRAGLAALDDQITNQTRFVQSARESFEPLTGVMQEGFVSKTQYEERRQQLLSAQVQLGQLQAQRAQLVGEMRQAEVALVELPTQTASKVNDLLTSQASLTQKRIEVENSRSYVLTAPVAGRISALQVSQGSTVSNQTSLMSIVSVGAKMHAELFAPSRAIGFAKVGQEVRLMYDAFPYQRFGSFGGRIAEISRTVLAPNEIDAPIQGQIKEPVYRIVVSIGDQTVRAFGDQVPLQPGMTLNANIVLDRRSFLDWMLEPVNAVRNRS